jgi:predicted RNA-binding protein with EMAP domain
MFSEMFDDLQASIDNLNSEDVGSIIETPEFGRMVNTITSGIKSGKYKVTDLTDMVAGIMSVVGDSLDSETKESFRYVLNTLEGVQRGEIPDVNKLMHTLKTLKLQ